MWCFPSGVWHLLSLPGNCSRWSSPVSLAPGTLGGIPVSATRRLHKASFCCFLLFQVQMCYYPMKGVQSVSLGGCMSWNSQSLESSESSI